MAKLGFEVVASDISNGAVERAKKEATNRNLTISFAIVDIRNLWEHYKKQFDLVICCDNSIAHCLTDEDVLHTLRQFYKCTKSGGGCVVGLRDYTRTQNEGNLIGLNGLRYSDNKRYLITQVWEFTDSNHYDTHLYVIEDSGEGNVQTFVFRYKMHAILSERLMELMIEAEFCNVKKLHNNMLVIGEKRI